MIATMISKCVDNLFPMAGGFGGGIFVVERTINHTHLLWMNYQQYAEAIIVIIIGGFIGGFIGWVVKRWLDWIFPKKKKL